MASSGGRGRTSVERRRGEVASSFVGSGAMEDASCLTGAGEGGSSKRWICMSAPSTAENACVA